MISLCFLVAALAVAVVARRTDWPDVVNEGPSKEMSPYGCSHGYYIPCDACSPAIRARYMRHPERFPVYIRDEQGHVLGVDRWDVAKP